MLDNLARTPARYSLNNAWRVLIQPFGGGQTFCALVKSPARTRLAFAPFGRRHPPLSSEAAKVVWSATPLDMRWRKWYVARQFMLRSGCVEEEEEDEE